VESLELGLNGIFWGLNGIDFWDFFGFFWKILKLIFVNPAYLIEP
jgi:hypothetical protein